MVLPPEMLIDAIVIFFMLFNNILDRLVPSSVGQAHEIAGIYMEPKASLYVDCHIMMLFTKKDIQ